MTSYLILLGELQGIMPAPVSYTHLDFAMNDKCAAGTGRFLEVMAATLEVELEELAALSKEASRPTPISSTCTVFAESEVVSLLAAGVPRAEIARGLHESVAARTSGLVYRVGLVEMCIRDRC